MNTKQAYDEILTRFEGRGRTSYNIRGKLEDSVKRLKRVLPLLEKVTQIFDDAPPLEKQLHSPKVLGVTQQAMSHLEDIKEDVLHLI
jgi:hypothetical protein